MRDHFFIIGAQRSGTSYLYRILDDHPEVSMAKPLFPEPKYFMPEKIVPNAYEDYFNLYFNSEIKTSCKIYGEKSTSYYETEAVAERIYSFCKHFKIIIILRNPVERALSNYRFSKENGIETRTITETFINSVPPPKIAMTTSVNPFNYLERGRYSEKIANFLKYIPQENFLILITEKTVENREEIEKMYRFLGVGESFVSPNLYQKINPSKYKQEEANTHIVRKKLYKYFEKEMRTLELDYNLDITPWKKQKEHVLSK